MFRPRTPNLSLSFTLFCITSMYLLTFGMYVVNEMYEDENSLQLSQTLDEIGISDDDKTIFFMNDDSLLEDYNLITGTDVMSGESYAKIDKTYEVDTLREEFLEIFGTQPEIKSHTGHEQKEIIFNKSMEIKRKEESTKNLRKQNYGLQKSNFNTKMGVKTKNKFVELLMKENNKLPTFVDKQRIELSQQTKTEKELESKLIQKGKELCDLATKMESISIVPELISIKTEIELSNFSKIKNEKLIEKENEISDLKTSQKELLELKSIEKENEIRDLELELIETTLMWLDFVNE